MLGVQSMAEIFSPQQSRVFSGNKAGQLPGLIVDVRDVLLGSVAGFGQGLVQISDQVGRIFQTNGNPYYIGACTGGLLLFR